jgi:diphosphomevalonate decarboxylase
MKSHSAAAQAHPNIALVKYWGNRDQVLRLPANGSISINLEGLFTRTRVTFDPSLPADQLRLQGAVQAGAGLARVSALLDRVRRMAGLAWRARVESENNFPTGAGIASSASAFAALSLAAAAAAGLALDEAGLSRLARSGSGSACRSVPGGFVEWLPGESDVDSYAVSIAPPEHWDVVDCIAVVSEAHKPTGSTQGHALADSSPLQAARIQDAPRRLAMCRRAILERDFQALAAVTEQDCNLMHAVMMTSGPPLLYWQPATVAVIQAVQDWRQAGLDVCYTIDAGPNVHVLCPGGLAEQVAGRLGAIPGVLGVRSAHPGGPARRVD